VFHSTASGKFMPADREEAAQMVKAAKMGMFDGLFADPHEPRR
jgi:hypothetical protein